MIKNLKCPICGVSLTTESAEMNAAVIAHHKEAHPKAAENIASSIMEIGALKDKIARIVKNVKRNTGYKIPGMENMSAALSKEQREELSSSEAVNVIKTFMEGSEKEAMNVVKRFEKNIPGFIDEK